MSRTALRQPSRARASSLVFAVVALALLALVAAPRVSLAAPYGGGARAFLGLATQPGDDGLVVVEVVPGSPAALAGVRTGDTLARIEDASPRTHEALAALVAAWVPGRAVSLQVRRGSSITSLRATLAAAPTEPRPAPGPAAVVGAPAPEVVAERVSGSDPVDLPALRGRVVLLDFWATWCGPCRRIMPELDRLHRALHAQGLSVIGLTDERPETVRAFLARTPVTYTLARDIGRTARRFGVRAMPTLVVVDRAGHVREVVVGGDAASLARVRALVEQLLREAAP
jgi:thiol-disulfide isomerase/thioredoxin